MDNLIKSVDTTEEAVEVSQQLQSQPSQHEFELKNWIDNNDSVTEATPEELKSISKTRQDEMEPNTEKSSMVELHLAVTDDSLQVCQ